jgi:hypothetical protein
VGISDKLCLPAAMNQVEDNSLKEKRNTIQGKQGETGVEKGGPSTPYE